MKRMPLTLALVIISLLLLATLATAQAEESIVTNLAEDGRFTTLLAAMEITETEQAFSEGQWTLFAPTDAAFAEMGLNAENIGSQLSLSETLDLLLYHALNEAATSDDAKKMLGDVTMANGWLAGLKWYDATLWINDDVRVTEANIFANNGIIHVVDQVITPPWPRTTEAADIAFLASLEEALQEEIQTTSAEAESEMESTEEAGADAAEEMDAEAVEEVVAIPEGSILDVMVKDGRFTTYLDAVGFLDLVEPYTEGEWTIFAPTDAAFAEAGIDADNVTGEFTVSELADLLLYHALDEEVSFDKAKTMLGDVTMRNGQLAGLKYFDDTIWVNDLSRVIDADIQATNGVIHAIDRVIERPWPRVETVEIPETESGQPANLPE